MNRIFALSVLAAFGTSTVARAQESPLPKEYNPTADLKASGQAYAFTPGRPMVPIPPSGGSISIRTESLVLYAGEAGGAGEKYRASSNPEKPAVYEITTGLNEDMQVVGVWYTPDDNLPALGQFSSINVWNHTDKLFKLSVAAYPSSKGRVRIAVHILYVRAEPPPKR